MDGRGGCCIARYAGGGAYDMSKVDRIMLRFRPIAPKPAASSPVSTGSPPDRGQCNEVNAIRGGRGKRRCAKEGGIRRCSRKRKPPADTDGTDGGVVVSGEAPVVTLPLLPETPVGKDSSAAVNQARTNLPIWLKFSKNAGDGHTDRGEVMTGSGPGSGGGIGSLVTVERVTETWGKMEGGTTASLASMLGSTDEERRANLERDACPGFISDGWNRVTWTNGAYRRMAAESGGGVGGAVGVAVAVVVAAKERVPWEHVGFTCSVRVQYYLCGGKEGQRMSSLTAPCDVWRMDAGGLAWRLDVNAALSLGR